MTDEMIVEAIRAVKLEASQGTEFAGASAPVANPDAVARFQAAMDVPPVEEAAKVEEIPFVDQMVSTWRTTQLNHQGILHRIRALSELTGKDGVSTAQLAELQYEVMNLTFQQEVVTKVADKVSNAVQTLIKNQ